MEESIKDYLAEIEEDLNEVEDSTEKLKLLVEYSQDIENYPKEKMKEENKVPGCVSNVYIDISINSDGLVKIYARSDVLIIGGFLSILVGAISNRDYKEVLENRLEIENFIKKIGVKNYLSPTRENAFGNIIEFIFSYLEKHRH